MRRAPGLDNLLSNRIHPNADRQFLISGRAMQVAGEALYTDLQDELNERDPPLTRGKLLGSGAPPRHLNGYAVALPEARLADSAPALASSLRLEQMEGPLAWAVDRPLFTLPDRPGSLIRVGSTELWLVCDGVETERNEPDIPISIDGVRYLVREDTGAEATVRPTDIALPCRLEVNLLAERATLSDGGATARIQASNRVALLPGLGKQWLEQPQRAHPSGPRQRRSGRARSLVHREAHRRDPHPRLRGPPVQLGLDPSWGPR